MKGHDSERTGGLETQSGRGALFLVALDMVPVLISGIEMLPGTMNPSTSTGHKGKRNVRRPRQRGDLTLGACAWVSKVRLLTRVANADNKNLHWEK